MTTYDEPPFDVLDDDTSTDVTTPERAAEHAVLGAMLLDPHTAIPHRHGTDYATPDHELLHDTLVNLHTTGTPIDPVTLVDTVQALLDAPPHKWPADPTEPCPACAIENNAARTLNAYRQRTGSAKP